MIGAGFPQVSFHVGLDRGPLSRAGSPARYGAGFPQVSFHVGLDRGPLSRAGSPARYGAGFPHVSFHVGLDRGPLSRAGSPARYGAGFPHVSFHVGLDRGPLSRAGSPARYGAGFPHWSISVGLERGRLRCAGSAVTLEVPRPGRRCLPGASSANRPRLLSTSGVSRRRHLERGCQRRYRSPGQPPSTTSWRAKNEYNYLITDAPIALRMLPINRGAGPGRRVLRGKVTQESQQHQQQHQFT